MERTLGPRDIGGLLKETFVIYRNNFWKLTTVVSIVAVPFAVLWLILDLVLPDAKGMSTTILNQIISIPLSIAYFIASILVAGAIIYVVGEQYFNKFIDTGRAYSFSRRKLGTMLGASILVALAAFGMAITFIGIPFAIYFLLTWTFIWQAALFESCGVRDSLSYSSSIVKYNWWRVFGIFLLYGIIFGTIGLILYSPALIGTFMWSIPKVMAGVPPGPPPTWTLVVGQIGGLIGTIITVPLYTIGETLLYFDLRVRHSRYDLNALANELGLKNTASDDLATAPGQPTN